MIAPAVPTRFKYICKYIKKKKKKNSKRNRDRKNMLNNTLHSLRPSQHHSGGVPIRAPAISLEPTQFVSIFVHIFGSTDRTEAI